jgi:hypothetical protein
MLTPAVIGPAVTEALFAPSANSVVGKSGWDASSSAAALAGTIADEPSNKTAAAIVLRSKTKAITVAVPVNFPGTLSPPGTEMKGPDAALGRGVFPRPQSRTIALRPTI